MFPDKQEAKQHIEDMKNVLVQRISSQIIFQNHLVLKSLERLHIAA